MITYIIRRLIQSFIVVIVVSVLIFLLMHLLPGDPLSLYIARNELQLTPETHQALLVQFGLDKPLVIQYLNWIGNLFQGNLGTSLIYNLKVISLITARFPITAYLAVLSLITAIVLASQRA